MTDREAIQLLEGLLRRPSPSGEEGRAAAYLVEQMAAAGMAAYVDGAGNAVGILGEGPRTLVLLGHIDTVPGAIPVRQEEGRLYGRGAADAKGPLAAFVAAVLRVGVRPGVRWVVVGAVEEETAASRGARFVAGQLRPDACVIGEPSGWDGIVLGYKGRLLVDLELVQPLAHRAGPDASVAEAAVALWTELRADAEAFNAGRRGAFERLQVRLRSLRTEDDGLEERARLTVAWRLPPGLSPAELEARVRRRLAPPPGGRLGVRFYGGEAAFRAPRTGPLAAAFAAAIRAEGGRPRFKVKTGTSDMNVVGPAWGCPILAYGPGDSRLDHTPQEHISLQEYLRGIRVLERALGRWAERGAASPSPQAPQAPR